MKLYDFLMLYETFFGTEGHTPNIHFNIEAHLIKEDDKSTTLTTSGTWEQIIEVLVEENLMDNLEIKDWRLLNLGDLIFVRILAKGEN